MSRKYKFLDQTKLYFVSFATVHWIDIFTRELYKTILLDSLKFCQQNKGLEIFAWCIMTNHVHLIIGITGMKMVDILRDFKSFTLRELKEVIKNNNQESRKEWMINMFDFAGRTNKKNIYFQLWKQHYRPIELNTPRRLEIVLNYVHNNPVKAGLVWEPWHFKYSSGIDYYTNEKGLLKVVKI